MQVNAKSIYGDVLRHEQVGHTACNTNGTEVRYTQTTTTLVRQNKAKTGEMKRLSPKAMRVMLEVSGDTHKSRALGKLIANCSGGRTGNIVFDSKSEKLNKAFAKFVGCTAPMASKILKWLMEEELVAKVGKTKLMANPFDILPNQLGSDAVAQLQGWWSDGTNEVIEWILKDEIDEIVVEHTDLLIERRKEQLLLQKAAVLESKKQDQHAIDNIDQAIPILEMMLRKYPLEKITPAHLRHYINKVGILKNVITLNNDKATQKLLIDYACKVNNNE